MKGRIGTSTGISKGKKIARSFFQKADKSRRRIKAMGNGALGGKVTDNVVVIPPKRREENERKVDAAAG